MRLSRVLAALDANADSTISAEEIASASAALKTLDKDGDGKLAVEEIRPVAPPNPMLASVPEDTINTLMEMDRNGDGKLSKTEIPERMRGMLTRGDANKDGSLTRDELKKMLEAEAAPVGRPLPPPTAGAGPAPAGNPMARLGPAVVALDADGDGVISTAEINNAPAMLGKLDKNGDGKLTEDEVRPAGGPGGGRGGRNPEEAASHLIEEFDKNSDGKLAKDEVPAGLQARFESLDTDKDGFLNKEELKKMAEQQGGPGGGRPAQRPPSQS